MRLTISTLAECPESLDSFLAMENPWPPFLQQDPIGNLYYTARVRELLAEYILVCRDDAGDVVAKAFSVPFRSNDEGLPADGWRGAIRAGLLALLQGATPDAVSAVEIVVRPDLQGHGLSAQVVLALRDNARRHGFGELLAPVRPNRKTDVAEPMESYAFRTRDDGLPVDPWLRVHVRAGGTIERVAPGSMVISGTLDEWRAWTGLPFDTSGPVEVPGALVPVWCDTVHGTAVYAEPNVWIRHPTR